MKNTTAIYVTSRLFQNYTDYYKILQINFLSTLFIWSTIDKFQSSWDHHQR
jgi:hypothetical protein